MQTLDLNIGIDFGVGGNLNEFSPVGFAPTPDSISTWSVAPVAELTFRLLAVRHDLRFTIEVFPYLVDGRVTRQDCWIYLHGLFVHYQPVTASLDIVFTVSRDLFSARANRLSFALPNATSPQELRLGEDRRRLGLAFVKLRAADATIVAAPPPRRA